MGKLQRRKGIRWELEVAQKLRQVGFDAERNLTEARTGIDRDIIIDAPLCVQCKVGQQPSVWRAIKEAAHGAHAGEHPVAILRRNRQASKPPEDLAVMPLANWLEMVAQLRACGTWS